LQLVFIIPGGGCGSIVFSHLIIIGLNESIVGGGGVGGDGREGHSSSLLYRDFVSLNY